MGYHEIQVKLHRCHTDEVNAETAICNCEMSDY